MKIAQFYDEGRLRVGLVQDGHLVPVDFKGEMLDLIRGSQICKPSGAPVPLHKARFAPVVSNPSKIIGIGLNYLDHIRESKGEMPKVPMVFAKFPSSLLAYGERITWDKGLTRKVDFEAELAVIIGKRASRCPANEIMDIIFGYTCANDVSARDLQFGDGQWVRGKSLDSFCPLGPWIVTPDEISDPHALAIRCWLNGQLMQDSHTGMMIFRLPELISFLSRYCTLLPGDVILTGTPHGVGTFRTPSIYLKEGDEVIVEIEGIGRLVNRCHAFSYS